jgi:hypothetical protein
MKGSTGLVLGLLAGIGCGTWLALLLFMGQPRTTTAASNDRYQDFVMTTGAVSINPKLQTDGVWMLDYKSGKLLGTVIDKALGKIIGWAEVDLVAEFNVAPQQDVHFMMVTGWVNLGQSALYVAETTTGKFGVYTMAPTVNGTGIAIMRHDMTSFREARPVNFAQPGAPAAPPLAAPGQPQPGVPPVMPPAAPLPGLPDTPPVRMPEIK